MDNNPQQARDQVRYDRDQEQYARDLFTAEGAPAAADRRTGSEARRALRIRHILDSKFDFGTHDMVRIEAPDWWSSHENEEGRKVLTAALGEKRRLEALGDEGLDAEFAGCKRGANRP